ncbi:endonuclease [Clostridium sp. SHJSY1]|uniref:endonuclease n=1 Tax=Clostridium sp. SHJSY1 TaxID=2942483 RepID=UPI002875B446|nr:endonuclease [Clostridium sp. SHJSY1]MDS0526029.1 endonuclease [Clostridium sp. SHJSY1]
MKFGKLKNKGCILISTLILAVVITCSIPKNAYSLTGTVSSTSSYSVAQAISNQNNDLKTVEGYIVGQPTAINTVLQSGFNGDTAIAIADGENETNTSKMIYIQVPSTYRNSFGLKTNPSVKGTEIKVSGNLTAYFSHAGIKNITDIVRVTSDGNGAGDDGNSDNGSTGGNTSSGSVLSPYDSSYYISAVGKTGTTLKSTLHKIISNNTKLSYSAIWDGIRDTDEDPNNSNNVILLYTGRSQGKNTNGSGVDNWNREHVWAKSHGNFGTSIGAGTDLHHLRAADASVNSTRGNLDFDEGGNPDKEATQCKYDSDSWEPRDSVKGDIARMLFYMAVRYEGENGEPDLELNEKVNNGTAPYFGKLSTLLKWNAEDPVDVTEMRRNDIIYNKYQHNRNPFIDHPEWANQIWN